MSEIEKDGFVTMEQGDAVNQPSHYTQQPVECIEITQYLNFTLGNAVKYLFSKLPVRQ